MTDSPPDEPAYLRQDPVAFCAAYKPTFWNRLGFGQCGAPLMEDLDGAPGLAESRLITNVKIALDWRDRLRLLLSGKLMVAVAIKTDVVINRTISRSNVSVLPPGSKVRAL